MGANFSEMKFRERCNFSPNHLGDLGGSFPFFIRANSRPFAVNNAFDPHSRLAILGKTLHSPAPRAV
jgi:hypothetical protein